MRSARASCLRGVWIAGIAALAAAPAGAGDLIAVEELVRAARTGSPELVAARERARAVLAAARVAGLRGDPELALWVRNALPDGDEAGTRGTALEVEVVQPVRWPGKREAAEAVAAAEGRTALYAVLAREQEVVARVRRTFAELVAADREQRSLAEAHELLDLLLATARARLGSAAEGALSVLEAELAVDMHDQDLDRVFAEFQSARARLATLAGVRPETLPLRVGELPSVTFAVPEGPMPFGSGAPSVELAQLLLQLAERRLEAARAGVKPDFGVGGGFLWPDGGAPELTLRFGVELPFLRGRRTAAQVEAIESEVSAARADLAAAELAGRAEAVRLGAERDRLEASRERLSGAIVPRSSVAFDVARSQFLHGEIPFTRVLELWNAWFEARVELAKAEADRFAIWAEAQALAGAPLEELLPESRP